MKTITVFVALIFFAFLPRMIFATEGACSWHDGVDCDARADWDGSVICNDGWRDSTVLFSNSTMCQKDCPWGYTDEFEEMIYNCITNDSDHTAELRQKLAYWEAVKAQYTTERNALYHDSMTASEQAEVIGLNSIIQGANEEIDWYANAVSDLEYQQLLSCKAFADSVGYLYCNANYHIDSVELVTDTSDLIEESVSINAIEVVNELSSARTNSAVEQSAREFIQDSFNAYAEVGLDDDVGSGDNVNNIEPAQEKKGASWLYRVIYMVKNAWLVAMSFLQR